MTILNIDSKTNDKKVLSLFRNNAFRGHLVV